VWQIATNVSEEYTASTFRAEEMLVKTRIHQHNPEEQ
jgi:hypothetical protein